MCGIAGVFLREQNLAVNKDAMLDSLLVSIEPRGDDATGFVAVGEDGVSEWHKASCTAKTFVAYRRFVPETTRVMLGHTRWATQGLPAFIENNHPIRRGPFYIVHNGHVSNDDELFVTSERARYGRVDSEAIAARLASLEDLSRLGEVMSEIQGDAAVAAVDNRDPSRLVLARGRRSPLWVYEGRVIVIFASTKDAIIKAHTECVGHIAEKNLREMAEGEQIEWRDQLIIRSNFEIPKPKYSVSIYTPAVDDSAYEAERAAWWENYRPRNTSAGVTARWDDDKEVECDNCTLSMAWLDAEYRYLRDEQVTLVFCGKCAEDWDWDKWEVLDNMVDGVAVEDEDDDEDDDVDDDGYRPIKLSGLEQPELEFEPHGQQDDYANANASILRNFLHRYL